ncbi:MAG: hypothetical protein RLZZ93_604, partial [Actinomycetota bacterium]
MRRGSIVAVMVFSLGDSLVGLGFWGFWDWAVRSLG